MPVPLPDLLLDGAKVAPSTWEPGTFADDLFLTQFVALCLKIRINGHEPVFATKHLVNILAHPPSDRAVVLHRRAVLSELTTSAALREGLEHLYITLCRFRGLLEGATSTGKWDANRRQLDILQLVKEIVDCMATRFSSAESGLSSLTKLGLGMQSSEPYRSLADLLRYDERLAMLKLEVRVGADGRIRGFEVLSIEEDDANPFVMSPWRRWFGKLELFLRGFRFSDGEVMARLIDAVFEGLQDDLVPLVQLLGDCEFYLGALGFHDRLAQLMAQSGLFVPARSGAVALAPGLVVSLIEETKADQAEGRLGTELLRIRQLFERLPPGAMVILDELCSGTNPSEGEEIFELVVRMLTRLAPQAFITTHFLTFASRLERERTIEDLRFLQVELGHEQQATYQFVPGVAQTSLAGHAAARLGVTRDQLMSLIDRNTAQAKVQAKAQIATGAPRHD